MGNTKMDGGLDKRGYPTGSDAKGKFSIVQVMDNQKEFKIYHTANSANRTPEDAEKHREMYFKMAEEYRTKKAPYNKAKEMGFELKECTQTNLIYKGEEVARGRKVIATLGGVLGLLHLAGIGGYV